MKCQSHVHVERNEIPPPAVIEWIDGIENRTVPLCESCKSLAERLMSQSRRMFGATVHRFGKVLTHD